ncbi:carboxymuconolactone decarboxylase family protein [Streptomyces griseocarneus]|uniref:carboxymuconolactone decarboxylase family protein n=1 Tax=Streptomyces griseocarneus TaxID=51201 RepID=UPI00167D1DC3|nr:carboxymuconolactone decarboxylase family protein [Streptomyces griseocarneus]MBZ6472325.1 carboxymuconolactone decarboxylase family protein [Streptomyces griseocarneus]GHG72614.1 alkyl hydroperoxide reductase AhpD [Streptomyces griseocarneus]
MTYQHPSDLQRVPAVRELAKTEANAFLAFHAAVFRDGGAIPLKYRELIALAVATATRCAYCIDTHTRGAAEAGATPHEMTEAAFVASAVSAGGAMAHSLLAHRLHEENQEGRS